ncbi:MarR family winged helix-turn-helix transcriptional regulator [Arsenicicoccus dermatophilus]|uniref:MarR family winged helix-turn-helix transcriptional regulator n=1 Tax=Arsenicicoccus dermatophilus TaxID=1076331 RepID=UPI003916DFE1
MTDHSPLPTLPARRLRRAVRELTLWSQAYVVRAARRRGMHDADVHAIGLVRAAGDRVVSPGDLGRSLALSPAAVSALLDRMERSGHVCRSRSDRDARRVELTLTDQALRTSDELFTPLVRAYDQVLAGYTDEELDLVVRVLDDLLAATVAAAPGGEQPRPR